MNEFKHHCQTQGIEYLLTFADNHATGFFKKKGFTSSLRMPKSQWKEFIKDYDSATLMECYLNPKIDFKNISRILKEQKEILLEKIREIVDFKLYPPLPFSAKQKSFPYESVQAFEDAGYTKEDF